MEQISFRCQVGFSQSNRIQFQFMGNPVKNGFNDNTSFRSAKASEGCVGWWLGLDGFANDAAILQGVTTSQAKHEDLDPGDGQVSRHASIGPDIVLGIQDLASLGVHFNPVLCDSFMTLARNVQVFGSGQCNPNWLVELLACHSGNYALVHPLLAAKSTSNPLDLDNDLVIGNAQDPGQLPVNGGVLLSASIDNHLVLFTNWNGNRGVGLHVEMLLTTWSDQAFKDLALASGLLLLEPLHFQVPSYHFQVVQIFALLHSILEVHDEGEVFVLNLD